MQQEGLVRTHYDVIIVGGRPAGSTLAARLGREGMHVLLLERSTFPSRPAASSPAIYASAMRLLDEIGADELEYARNTPRIRRWVIEIADAFRVTNPVPNALGRSYGYAIDRARFDAALLVTAARSATVTVRQPFAVTEILRDGDQVTGVRGRAPGREEETFTADCVVGADGRFSLVARHAAARIVEEDTANPTTLYYAYWKNVAPYDQAGPAIHAFGPGQGYGFLLMDSADDTVAVVVEGQAGLLTPGPDKGEGVYLRLLRAHPRVWRRLQQAERVTPVHGMREVGNLYREAGGAGWVLVGDALHQKDPLDGQGIYDALFGAKALSEALAAWKRGSQTWMQAIAGYEAVVRAETEPMYRNTLDRVKNELYSQAPAWTMTTTLRWLLEDPEYQRRLGLVLVRALDVRTAYPSVVILRALARGALSDLGYRIGKRQRPNDLPSIALPNRG